MIHSHSFITDATDTWKLTVSLNTALNYCHWYEFLHNTDAVYCFFKTKKNITTTFILRSVLVWNYTLHRIVVSDWLFWTTCRFYLRSSSLTPWPLEMVPLGSPEMSVGHYHSRLRKIPKKGRTHLHRGVSLKSWNNRPFRHATDTVQRINVYYLLVL